MEALDASIESVSRTLNGAVRSIEMEALGASIESVNRTLNGAVVRHAASVGMSTICTGLAALCADECNVRHAGAGIVFAIAVEMGLGSAFALARRTSR